MNRQQKEAAVASLKENFSGSSASFVVGVGGLSVEKFESLRKLLRQEGSTLHVAKVRLMKRAMQDVQNVQGLEPFLKEQIALVFAQKEAPAVAKILCGFAKENQVFTVLAGCMDSAILDKDAVKVIASLPPREILLAHLAATLNAPIVGFVVVLSRILEKLEEEQKTQ